MKRLFFLTCLILSTSLMGIEEAYFKPKTFKHPKREVSVIAAKEGYYPQKIFAFAGEEVQFYITGSQDFPSCFIIENHDVFLPATPGAISEKSLVFEKVGVHKFYCPQGKIQGEIVVQEHPQVKREKELRRKLASKNKVSPKVKIWRPRDE